MIDYELVDFGNEDSIITIGTITAESSYSYTQYWDFELTINKCSSNECDKAHDWSKAG